MPRLWPWSVRTNSQVDVLQTYKSNDSPSAQNSRWYYTMPSNISRKRYHTRTDENVSPCQSTDSSTSLWRWTSVCSTTINPGDFTLHWFWQQMSHNTLKFLLFFPHHRFTFLVCSYYTWKIGEKQTEFWLSDIFCGLVSKAWRRHRKRIPLEVRTVNHT